MMMIKIAQEYTDTPGARYIVQGPYSGEEFRDDILLNKYLKCVKKNEKLVVDLDGGYGYGSSFLEESFGGLVRRLKKDGKEYKKVNEYIEIISNDEPSWIEKIYGYISKEIKNK